MRGNGHVQASCKLSVARDCGHRRKRSICFHALVLLGELRACIGAARMAEHPNAAQIEAVKEHVFPVGVPGGCLIGCTPDPRSTTKRPSEERPSRISRTS